MARTTSPWSRTAGWGDGEKTECALIRGTARRIQPIADLHRKNFFRVVCLSLLFPVMVAGCRKKGPEFDIITLEGKIDNIERASQQEGEITVIYYSEKRKQEVAGVGRVTPDTEIMINGAEAKLADLREGDRVRGEVRVETKGDKQRRTVLNIYVDRPKPMGGGG